MFKTQHPNFKVEFKFDSRDQCSLKSIFIIKLIIDINIVR